MTWRIDLNCDLGEGAGHDREIIPYITSANIACGVHAGSPEMMRQTALMAAQAGVGIGAHPGIGGAGGMGRQEVAVTPEEAYTLVLRQVAAMREVTDAHRLELRHVKPHGTLYNLAARDAHVAKAVAEAVRDAGGGLILLALAGSELVAAGRAAGLVVAAEAFADRTYQADGTLTPRSDTGAMILDPALAAGRALMLIKARKLLTVDGGEIACQADTLCVHGDSPGAAEMLGRLRQTLIREGIEIRRLGQP